MRIVKTALGVTLSFVGAVLIFFEFGMTVAEPHAFEWVPFSLYLLVAGAILAGGILLTVNLTTITGGIILCIVGVVFVCFASVEAISEWHSFLRDGWVPFLVFVVLGVVIFAGGVLLCKR